MYDIGSYSVGCKTCFSLTTVIQSWGSHLWSSRIPESVRCIPELIFSYLHSHCSCRSNHGGFSNCCHVVAHIKHVVIA